MTFLCIKHIPGKVDMSSNSLWNPIAFYILACCWTYVLYFACDLITKTQLKKNIVKLFSYIGEHTISIMCLHFVFIKLVDLIYINLFTRKYEILSNFPYSYNKLFPFYLLAGIVFPILLELLIKIIKNQLQKVKKNFS